MMKSRCIGLIYFYILFKSSFCKQVSIKNATFAEFWFDDKAFLLAGTGVQWKLSKDKDSVETCSNGEEAEMWLLTKPVNAAKILYDVQVYVEIEAQMRKCEGIYDCFKDGFELYRYIGEGELDVPYDEKNLENIKQEKKNASEYFNNNFAYVGNITGNATIKERVTKRLSLTLEEFRGITFGIKSRGACGDIFRMNVYYYVCEEKFIHSVMFNETLSPPNGTKVVFGNCSLNSRPELSMDSLKAYCYSNGTWSEETNIKCNCDKGYEPTTKLGCTLCQDLWYKPSVANKKCIKCPRNTESAKNFATCACKDGYYKLSSNSISENPPSCYAPIKIDRPLIEKVKDSINSVNITWFPPVNNSRINETIFYDIHCYICVNETFCNTKCTNLVYTPGQFNITETYVRVSGLVDKTYKFRVFPKNSLNKVIPREKWEFSASDVYKFSAKKNPSGSGEGNFTYLVVIVCVASLTLLLVVFFITFLLRRRKEKNGLFHGLLANGVELPKTGKKTYVDPSNYDRPEDAICEFATEIDASRLYLEMLIGGGEFGDVYKGSMTGDDGKKIPVAVKTLKKDANAKSEKDFLLEASVMGQFDCPNVIKLIGVVTKYRPWMIVIEFMSNGSLDNFLKANDGRLSHLELINMAKGVAVGMEYLSGMNFVHRDLAARNILIDGNMVCKVSDFGLSRELEATDSSQGEYATTGGKIPIRWTAPEATKYRKFSSSSDVWSFGILLWEIMSFAERPYWEWDNFKVMEEVDNGFRLPAPLNCPKGVHDLMMQCWKKERTERPNFNEINSVLDGWIQAPKTMEGEVDLCAALREWLQSIKMSDYVTNFTAAGYQRPCELYGIKEHDLKEMGISLVGHRNKILKGIKNLPGNKKAKRALQREVSLEV